MSEFEPTTQAAQDLEVHATERLRAARASHTPAIDRFLGSSTRTTSTRVSLRNGWEWSSRTFY